MLYHITLLLRLAFVFMHGYVHPDEFFQSIEITSHHLLHYHAFIPWEYQPEFACRSIVIPMISTGIPVFILQLLGNLFNALFGVDILKGWVLLYVPRLWVFVLSLCMDFSMYKILSKQSLPGGLHGVHKMLVLFGSSWITMVFGTKYFSNSIEAFVTAVAIAVAFTSSPNYMSKTRGLILGGIFALGIFTRFTFVFLIPPIGLYMLYIQDRPIAYNTTATRIYQAFKFVMVVGIGFLVVSTFCVLIDSLYFGKVTVAPLNNFIYNLSPSNLASHGIHHRATHLLVNVPLLLGPLALVSFANFFKVLSFSGRNRKQFSSALRFPETVAAVGCITTYLFFLSLAPHQELRFLVPIVFPTVLVFGHHALTFSVRWWKAFVVVWVVWNGLSASMFGVLHQGGVTKALCSLNNQIWHQSSFDSPPAHFQPDDHIDVIFSGTYMPPRFLLAIPESEASRIQVYDIASTDLNTFTSARCSNFTFTPPSDKGSHTMFIVCPLTINELTALDTSGERKEFYDKLELMEVFWPHFSGEQFRADLSLRMYKYTREK